MHQRRKRMLKGIDLIIILWEAAKTQQNHSAKVKEREQAVHRLEGTSTYLEFFCSPQPQA